MDNCKREILKMLGGIGTEISFPNHKKVLIEYYEETSIKKEEIRENVYSIDVIKQGDVTSIDVNYKIDEGDGAIGSPIQHIRKITILD